MTEMVEDRKVKDSYIEDNDVKDTNVDIIICYFFQCIVIIALVASARVMIRMSLEFSALGLVM